LFFAVQGAGESFIYWTFLVNDGYGSSSLADAVRAAIDRLRAFPVLWQAAFAGGVLEMYRRTKLGEALLFSSLGAASCIPLVVSQSPHYLLPALPFAAILAAAMADSIRRWVEPSLGRQRAVILTIVLLLVAGQGAGFHAINELEATETGTTLESQQDIAALTSAHLSDGNQMLVVAAEPQHYFLADYLPDSQNVYYLSINRGETYTPEGVVRDVESNPPKVLVVRTTQCGSAGDVCECASPSGQYRIVGEFSRSVVVYVRDS